MFIISAPGEFHSTYEDELKMIIALSGWIENNTFYICLFDWLVEFYIKGMAR